FEQTLNCLLLPGAGGVPTWWNDQPGERTMIKLPEQFASLRERQTPLDEKVGRSLAKWARGEPAEAMKDGPRQFVANDAGAGIVEPDTPAEQETSNPPDESPAWAAHAAELREKIAVATTRADYTACNKEFTRMSAGLPDEVYDELNGLLI